MNQADVGADLSGTNKYGLAASDKRNPACITDVGSFAVATCAAHIAVGVVSLVLPTVIYEVERRAVERHCGYPHHQHCASQPRGKFLMSLVSAVHPPPHQLPPIQIGRS